MSTELAPHPTRWTTAQTRQQFLNICWLRWRIFLNGFRRKGSTSELVAKIILVPIFAAFAFGPSVLAFVGGFYFANNGQLNRIAWLLWGTFALCQLLNIQLGQPGSTFNPTELIRFPMRVGTYTAIRLFFGMLAPSNIIGTLVSFSIWLGITIAKPTLWLTAGVALAIFAMTNVLFSRMIFTWVDRWLSTRRAREVFTGLIFAFSIGVQYLNFAFNPAYNHGHGHTDPGAKLRGMQHLYTQALPFLQYLPPELTSRSIVAAAQHSVTGFAEFSLACLIFGLVFFIVFAVRIRTEFRGESLSDVANAVAKSPAKTMNKTLNKTNALKPASMIGRSDSPARPEVLPPVVSAVLGKELLYLRRNVGLFYGLLMPIVLVFLFAGRLASRHPAPWIFPAAVAYSLLGITPLSYNSFGLEGTGSQFYFLAPVRLGDVLLAKNLLQFVLALVEFSAVFAIITYVAGRPTLQTAVVALLWAAGTILLNTILGNRRSITAPKKIAVGRVAGKQANQLSAMIGLGIMGASTSVAAGLLIAAYFAHLLWTLVPIFGIFAAVALYFYLKSLRSIDGFILAHREQLFTELCKPD